ncbi:hypothetical protein J2T12_001012 [Paenibacillus anaericanus]|nr:hypothetical protein [Paenibacillus anaericanus]
MSIFNGTIELYSFRNSYPNLSYLEVINYLRKGPAINATYDYRRALILGEKLNWNIPINKNRQQVLMQMIKSLVFEVKPMWACCSHLGINKTTALMDMDELQLFYSAGLLDISLSVEALQWWDDIAKFSRSLVEERKLSLGREGERRTLEHERSRLNSQKIEREPQWVAHFDNMAGYDILSYNWTEDGITELFIEVKAYMIGPLHFFVTRSEWLKALNHPSNYIFHIWNLELNDLTIFTVENLLDHIPINQGEGVWENVKICLDDCNDSS